VESRPRSGPDTSWSVRRGSIVLPGAVGPVAVVGGLRASARRVVIQWVTTLPPDIDPSTGRIDGLVGCGESRQEEAP
jgi:hypothetical protein